MIDEVAEVLSDETRWRGLREGLFSWASSSETVFPWRKQLPEWQALVTEVLLQRTRAEAVAAIYDTFFSEFDRPEKIAAATEDEIRHAMWSLGLLWRARYLKALGAALSAGEVPDNEAELRELPGVGPYAAGAYLALHRNIPAPLVDANVVRLLSRFWGFEYDGETRRRRWFLRLVEHLFDTDYEPREYGYAVLDFTRQVCSPKPHCDVCPLTKDCAHAAVLQESGPEGRNA